MKDKLLKELYFMCLVSDNVIESPFASIGVRDTAFKMLRPIIQQTALKAVEIMTEVIQKREISADVNRFFQVTYTVLGEDIYRMILLKIADGISEDDGIFMIQYYTSVTKLRMDDFKTIFDKISKKNESRAVAGAVSADNTNRQTRETAMFTAAPQARSWLSRIFNFKVIPSLLYFISILVKSASANRPMGSNLVGGNDGSWAIMRSERLCDLVPKTYETKAELTVQEIDETPDVPISSSVHDLDWYSELCVRDVPLDASLLVFANMDDLFPKTMSSTISESLTSEPLANDDSTVTAHTSGFPKKTPSTHSANEQATATTSTADTILMDTLSKRQGTPMGSLFANVPDLFSTNELRPAFDECTSRADENATVVAPPEESDSSNGLGDFDFPSMFESDWKERIGCSRVPVEQSNSARLFPINLPDDILKSLQNENEYGNQN